MGAGAYICGEETGLIESLEGKRAWPRIKPPFPAIEGVFRKPTVVNNIETMACVAQIARRGIEWFRSIGIPADPNNPRDPGSYGPKLYCLSGHVEKPGCYEAPLGITARELIDRFGLLPDETKRLFKITALKIRAQVLGIKKIQLKGEWAFIRFTEHTSISPEIIIKLVQVHAARYKFKDPTTIRVKINQQQEKVSEIEKILFELTGAC